MGKVEIHPPTRVKQILEKLCVREVDPKDLCDNLAELDKLYRKYPDLAGDSTAIGPGDDGSCQSWRGDWGWWKRLMKQEQGVTPGGIEPPLSG